jgi:hypothetical protein
MATVVRPEIHTITLASGETLVVKKRLNAGERREMLKTMRLPDGRGDGLMTGPACVLAYLVDWTVTDQEGKPLIIREQPREMVAKTLDALDVEDYKEIELLIELHDENMSAERRAAKKKTDPAVAGSEGGLSEYESIVRTKLAICSRFGFAYDDVDHLDADVYDICVRIMNEENRSQPVTE